MLRVGSYSECGTCGFCGVRRPFNRYASWESGLRSVPETEDGCTTSGSSGRTAHLPTRRTYRSAVLDWRQGDEIPLNADRTLRVLGVRDEDADQPPALVVEDLPGSATSAAG